MKHSRILFLIAGIFIFLSINCGQPKTGAEEKAAAIPVGVQTIELGNVVQSLEYTGDIKAEYEVKVFSKIPDRIEKLYVDAGMKVQRGGTLAKIYATMIEQGVRQAEAGLVATQAQAANLKLEYDRAERLHRENAMSKQQYDAIKTQYEATMAQMDQVKAGLASAKSQLSDATITAPISGIIGKRFYEEGDMASPAMPVMTVVQMDRVKILLDATENDLGKLSVGQHANVTVKSYPDEMFEGKVVKISPVLDPISRMAEVEVLVNNPGHRLKPGMFAEVEVITGTIQDIVVVPRYVTIENTTLEKVAGKDEVLKNYFVFVVENDKAIQRKLNVKYVNHVNIAVNSGVNVGERLVVAGQNNLRDSVEVLVVK
jgi:RND family efflux transporter MFP subunit